MTDTASAGADASASAGTNASAAETKTFTQEQVNALIARERKSLEAKIKADSDTAIGELRSKLEQLELEKADAGKSAAEKEKAAAARQLATYEAKLAELAKAKDEASSLAAQQAQALRDTKVDYALNSLLATHKVLPEATRFALKGFRDDAKIEYDETGAIAAVDVLDKRFTKLDDAVAEWMKQHGALFTAAPSGGAGTRASNGLGGKTLSKQSTEDLIAAANEMRGRR
jgi:hypothetical protein